MSIKQEPDTVIENVREVEPDSSDTRDRKKKIISEDSLLQVKTECYIEEEDSALPNSIKSHGLWLDFIKPDMSDQVSTLDDSRIDKGSSQRDDQTELEPGCSDRDVKIENTECLPQVKTECCHEEDGRVLNPIKSEEQRLNFNIPDIEEQINIADISSCQGGYHDNTDSVQKTRVMPNNLQTPYTYATGTHCENQDMPLEDGKESLVHCSQILVKSDLNIPTDINTDDKICVSRDVNDFHKYLLTSDDVFPSQQDQVKLYECVACPYSSNHLFELHQHKTSHKMEHFYVCDLCQSTYQYFLDLKCHLKSHRAQDDNSLQLFYGSKKYSSVIKACQDVQWGDKIYRKNNICTENDSEFKYTSPHGIIACKIACKPEEQRESQTGLGNSLVRDISKYQSIEQRKSPSDETYGCNQGEYVCRRVYKLKQPKTKHAGKKQYSCDLCNYASKWSANLRRHKRKHRGKKPYSCELCDFTCSTGSNLKQHKRKHRGEIPYSCDLCDYVCAQSGLLKKHKIKHTDEKPYSCDLCDNSSAYSGHLKQHKTKHTGEKPYSCDLCDYACAFSRQLKLHKRKHTGEKPYSCDLCDFTCACSANLSRHKRKHTGEKPYTCNLCDFTCAHSCYLKTHKRTHTGQKPYSCDFCDFTCAHPSSFRRHKLRKHTDKKPHCCDVCDFTCAQLSDLKEHKRKHIAEKIYSCDLCDYACAYSCNLKVHKRTHTGEKPFTCDLCGFTCAQSGHLQKHKRTHTGEKPYSCDLCDFTCAQLTHLKEHERTHTGEKPYSCDLCDFTCAHSANLSRHKRKHTDDKT